MHRVIRKVRGQSTSYNIKSSNLITTNLTSLPQTVTTEANQLT